jgi:predicted alpha/beta hydrolase
MLKSSPLKEYSYFLEVGTETLHLKRFHINPDGEPVFLLHGSIEDGRIYYSKSGKGLAPFLARQGYDVFIPDMSGKGQSTPKISKRSTQGLTEIITEEIPAILNKIKEFKGEMPQYWIGHSWGGTLQYAYLLRFPNKVKVKSMVHFGVKRRITAFNWNKLFMINIGWHFLGGIMTKIYGYTPITKLGFGSEDEARNYYYQTNQWFRKKRWIDADGFNYSAQIRNTNLPPSLFMNGIKDDALGTYGSRNIFSK